MAAIRSTGPAHIIEDEGIVLTQRPNMNFVGAGVAVTDAGGKTLVNIPGGATNINVKGFRSINAYGAVQDGVTDCTAAVAACQAALVADGSGFYIGGIMFIPPGITVMNTSGFALHDGITIQGAGRFSSIIYCPTDAGAGTYLLVADSIYTPAAPSLRDLTLLGPGNASVGVGVKPCEMSGYNSGYWATTNNIAVQNWNKGMNVRGDHCEFRKSEFSNCFDGVYFGSGWLSKGDQSFYDCVFGGKRSGVYCTGDNSIDSVIFDNCHWVGSPFGLLRSNDSTCGGAFLRQTVFRSSGWEQIGNSAIADLCNNAQDSWIDCTIDGSGYSYNAGYYLNTFSRAAAINLPNLCMGGYIRKDELIPFNFGGGSAAYIFGGYGVEIRGGVKNAIQGAMFDRGNGTYRDDNGNVFHSVVPTGTVAVGDIVEQLADGTVQRATGTPTTKLLRGVAYTDSASAGAIMVAVNTMGFVKINAGDAITGIVPICQKTGAYHTVAPAASYPSNPIIGFSFGSSSGGLVDTRTNFLRGGA